jgi:glycosyltransferase involved in cell wall biosynthesis
MKNILIITHYCSVFWSRGNNRFNYLASLLVQKGFSVEFVTSDFSHGKKEHIDATEAQCEYQVRLIHEPGYPKNVCLRRFYSHNRFGRNLNKYLFGIQKPDLVYAAVPSLDAALTAEKYCARNGIPFVVDIQDLWPETFGLVFKVPVLNRLFFWPHKSMAERIYKGADKIIGVSDTYVERGMRANRKGGRGLNVFLGTDLRRFDRAASRPFAGKPEGEIWIVYAGTLGHSYNLELVMDAVRRLKNDGIENIVFKVLGDGPLLERFSSYARQTDIRADFLGRLPYEDMVGYLKHADIAVNPIMKGAQNSILNKHGDYAAAGLPVVNTQECPEYRRLIEKYGCGINCGVQNAQEVADAIAFLVRSRESAARMGEASRRMAEERFDRSRTYINIVEAIEELL